MAAYRHLQQEHNSTLQHQGNLSTRIRVALIDTGVDETLLDASFCNSKGASFVSDGQSESPWWFARTKHGTYMAHVIHSIDPYCEFRFASVGETKRDFAADRVARVSRISSPSRCLNGLAQTDPVLGNRLGHQRRGRYHLHVLFYRGEEQHAEPGCSRSCKQRHCYAC